MCQEKATVREIDSEVVLCCDAHITAGFHYDQLQNIEWRVPGTSVPARTAEPLHKMYVHKGKPLERKLAHA